MYAQALAQAPTPPGEGDPTDNAVGWYKHLNNEAERQPGELRGVRCATFALGNRQYEHFCYMGRWMDAKLVAYGATPRRPSSPLVRVRVRVRVSAFRQHLALELRRGRARDLAASGAERLPQRCLPPLEVRLQVVVVVALAERAQPRRP